MGGRLIEAATELRQLMNKELSEKELADFNKLFYKGEPAPETDRDVCYSDDGVGLLTSKALLNSKN